jgi:hypothetical protein
MADIPSRQELIDLYESYQEYQHAKQIAEVRHDTHTHVGDVGSQYAHGCTKGCARVTTQTRLPVIDQRRKWAKHIGDYLASLQVSGEQVHTHTHTTHTWHTHGTTHNYCWLNECGAVR